MIGEQDEEQLSLIFAVVDWIDLCFFMSPNWVRLLCKSPLNLSLSVSSPWKIDNPLSCRFLQKAQELCESRGGRLGLPSLISLRFLWT